MVTSERIDRMKLTEKEKQLILEKRKLEESNIAKKVGYLKHNLYTTDFDIKYPQTYDTLCTAKVRQQYIQKFNKAIRDACCLAAPKGTKFVCFINLNKSESWYDDMNYGIENRSSVWARSNLVNIQNIN